jgi:phosphoglycerate dehydrogenase-like enzyme
MPIVLGYDTAEDKRVALRESGFEITPLEELYARADYISIHVPLTPETLNMIDAQAIAKMKPGVRIICTARGGIIDEAALLAALESGHVAGAGLDVFAQEPPGATPLISHPNVIATPHIGAQTQEAQNRAGEDIASEVVAALRGQPLRWKVA